jgi:AAA+ superfamily predicted ATPase
MDAISDEAQLPHADYAAAWSAIKLDDAVRTRLVAQALLAFQLRQHFPFERVPVHGLIVLAGPPGTGKTTLARGLANQVAEALKPKKVKFLQLDPHAFGSASHGKSQKEVSKIFDQLIPEHAALGPTIVLLDEVETLAADRQRMSLETNPVDAHRATDAALAGIDLLSRKHRNTLLIATTNFLKAVDRALLSRADLVEDIGLPNAHARQEIIGDTLAALASQWPSLSRLNGQIPAFVKASDGLDGRRLRKAIISAAASSVETARDLNKLQADQVLKALKQALEIEKAQEKFG